MCGIAGLLSFPSLKPNDRESVRKMASLQKHRGPDDEGTYDDAVCALGHRRLSIIDLSRDGRQPFSSANGNLLMVYNGEIYNYIELREELKKRGRKFRTKTDTEVLLAAYEEYGERCLDKLNGMFAFVVYNKQSQTFFLARDRLGIKPLYYWHKDNRLFFASEVKPLLRLPGFKASLNRQALFDYLVFNRTDVFDETFVETIKRIPKGHFGIFDKNGLTLKRWWNPEKFLHKNGTQIRPKEIFSRIEEILVSAVTLRMRSDVPVGSCLSGGLDSTILTGILFSYKLAAGDYASFTASFPGDPLDESDYIRELNKKYPFKNFKTYPTTDKAFQELETFVFASDEPTLSPAFFCQYEVMRLAKEHNVTVLLDGQGGDENFAGYQYFHGFYLRGLFRRLRWDKLLFELLRIILRRQDPLAYQVLLFQLMPDALRQSLLRRQASFLQPEFFYAHIGTSRIYREFFDAYDLNTSIVRHFQYKLEHLLRTEDRNSMAFSIEARVPYLDHRLVEYLLGLNEDLKIKAGQTKWLQKQAVGKYTVDKILDRKDKIAFSVPQEKWLRQEKWQSMLKECHADLVRSYPEIFKHPSPLPTKGNTWWKIIQLAVWKNTFL